MSLETMQWQHRYGKFRHVLKCTEEAKLMHLTFYHLEVPLDSAVALFPMCLYLPFLHCRSLQDPKFNIGNEVLRYCWRNWEKYAWARWSIPASHCQLSWHRKRKRADSVAQDEEVLQGQG